MYLADTITKLGPQAAAALVISGSHGGLYPGYLAARAGVSAVILNDAGIGKDEAGIGALAYLEAYGVAAATVSHLSCRIGDTADMVARGRISHCNRLARALGVRAGETCADAAAKLERAVRPFDAATPPHREETARQIPDDGARRIFLIDSASMAAPEHVGQIVVTGSHGGLIGGDPAMALRVDAFAAAFHDAGIGVEKSGVTRLPALDQRGIAAVAIAADSARIGDAASLYETGIVSAANATAQRLGAAAGQALAPLLTRWSRTP